MDVQQIQQIIITVQIMKAVSNEKATPKGFGCYPSAETTKHTAELKALCGSLVGLIMQEMQQQNSSLITNKTDVGLKVIGRQSKKEVNETFTDKFIKKYKQLHLPKEAPFDERLRFDVYKREAKLHKYQDFLSKKQKRLPSEQLNQTFDHLIKDALRRKDLNERVQEEISNESNWDKLGIKKLTLAESNKIYEKHMEKWNKRNKAITEKQKETEYKEEMMLLNFKAKQNKPHTRGGSLHIVKRMDEDVRNRKEKALALKKEKQDQEDQEVPFLQDQSQLSEMFMPNINKVKITGKIHTKSELNKTNVYQRLENDVKTRKVKDMIRQEANRSPQEVTKYKGDSLKTVPVMHAERIRKGSPFHRRDDSDSTPRFEHSRVSNKVLSMSFCYRDKASRGKFKAGHSRSEC
eukprot:TRINITY_DN430_c0_g2_i2.p1 TRINITY_DN430_c0_g2~~TRINITY_DN430_c0_g2_i2.p1  ORF type:complete len:406 (+),score=37.78 TRINITY_DN430_c0_g2_i2:4551-5768(+)